MNYCPGCGLARPAVADVNYCPGCGGSLNPAAPNQANLSGWWPRVGATLLDGLIVMALNAPALGSRSPSQPAAACTCTRRPSATPPTRSPTR